MRVQNNIFTLHSLLVKQPKVFLEEKTQYTRFEGAKAYNALYKQPLSNVGNIALPVKVTLLLNVQPKTHFQEQVKSAESLASREKRSDPTGNKIQRPLFTFLCTRPSTGNIFVVVFFDIGFPNAGNTAIIIKIERIFIPPRITTTVSPLR